jgi:cyclic pyranopterin phosphate synthase
MGVWRMTRKEITLKDKIGRQVDYLRVSVTDRCNLRCKYCMPPEGVKLADRQETLSYEEILEVIRVAKSIGITHIRITGGEPLVRKDLPSLVQRIKELGIPDISMTTNGVLLQEYAQKLKESGLDRVNISLDSLDPSTFRSITRNGNVEDVMAGIKAALAAGLHPVKINVVMMKETNESEILDIARLSINSPLHVRFIEVMPIGTDHDEEHSFITAKDALEKIQSHYKLLRTKGPRAAGPANYYQIEGAKGTIGVISAMSEPFCSTCNRMRLTHDGKLRPCLASDTEIDLKPILRGNNPTRSRPILGQVYEQKVQQELQEAFETALSLKPKGHELWNHTARSRRMCQIGG